MIDRKTTGCLEVNFEFPPTAVRILVIFQYVVADIITYSKSLHPAETVKFWLRTSSRCGVIIVRPVPCLRLKNPRVVFVEPYLSNSTTEFNKSFFKIISLNLTTIKPNFSSIDWILGELFKKQKRPTLSRHPVVFRSIISEIY